MLEKMYRKEEPFRSRWKFSLVPATYRGYSTMQLLVNNIDIGFISQKDMKQMDDFVLLQVHCIMKESAKGRKLYYCYLSGVKKDDLSHIGASNRCGV